MTERQEVNLKLDVSQELDAHLLEQSEAMVVLWGRLVEFVRSYPGPLRRDAIENFAAIPENRGIVQSVTASHVGVILYRLWKSNLPLVIEPETVYFGALRTRIIFENQSPMISFHGKKIGIISGDIPDVPGEFGLGAFHRVNGEWFLRGRIAMPRKVDPVHEVSRREFVPKDSYTKSYLDTVADLGSYQLPTETGCAPVSIRLGRREDLIKLSLGWLMDHPQAPTAMVLGYR